MFHTFCSTSYIHWLELWINAIRLFHPTEKVLVHFVEMADGDFHLVQHDDPNLVISPPFCRPDPEWLNPDRPQGERGAILLETRTKNVLEVALREDYDHLLVMDVDTLVRAPLTKLFSYLKIYDFAAVIRGQNNGAQLPPHLETSAAFYALSKKGIPVVRQSTFVSSEKQEVRGIRKREWFWDQAVHTESVFTSDVRMLTLPRERYLSSRPFEQSAYVWNGNFRATQGQAAFIYFRNELNRLAAQFNRSLAVKFNCDALNDSVVK